MPAVKNHQPPATPMAELPGPAAAPPAAWAAPPPRGRPSWVQRLLLATVHAGILRYVGRLRTGEAGPDLARRLAARRRACPVVSCPSPACWVEPELYCRVAFQGWTIHGRLRYPVFAGWLESSP